MLINRTKSFCREDNESNVVGPLVTSHPLQPPVASRSKQTDPDVFDTLTFRRHEAAVGSSVFIGARPPVFIDVVNPRRSRRPSLSFSAAASSPSQPPWNTSMPRESVLATIFLFHCDINNCSIIISKTFAVEKCLTLTWTFRKRRGKMMFQSEAYVWLSIWQQL